MLVSRRITLVGILLLTIACLHQQATGQEIEVRARYELPEVDHQLLVNSRADSLYTAEFVGYKFDDGKNFQFDSKSRVTISMRNTSPNVWRPGELTLNQNPNDINWRAEFPSPLPDRLILPGETVDLTFYVTPKPCPIFGEIFCYAKTFKWQIWYYTIPLIRPVELGEQTPDAGISVHYQPTAPTNPPPGYKGVISTPPPGGPAPAWVPAVVFPLYR
jgi:hypothetical protein